MFYVLIVTTTRFVLPEILVGISKGEEILKVYQYTLSSSMSKECTSSAFSTGVPLHYRLANVALWKLFEVVELNDMLIIPYVQRHK